MVAESDRRKVGEYHQQSDDLVFKFVDTVGGHSSQTLSKEDVSKFLDRETAFEELAMVVVPSIAENDNCSTSLTEKEMKCSYHAMRVLAGDDVSESLGFMKVTPFDRLLNSGKAGLLTKYLFQAYLPTSKAYLPHVNHILSSLLCKYPNAIITAVCAGGADGLQTNLGSMLALRGDHISSSFSLSVFANIIVKGCCDCAVLPNNRPTSMQVGQSSQITKPADQISKGHRRKFIRSLEEWDLVTNVLEQITCPQLISPTQSSEEEIAIARELHADAASEAFVTIVESIAFPSATQNNNDESKNGESLGEELVLKSLGEQEVVSRLVCAATLKGSADSANCDHQMKTAAASTLLRIFQLSKERRKAAGADCPPSSMEESKLFKCGLTEKLYHNLTCHVDEITDGLELQPFNAKDDDLVEQSVKHPGGYELRKPFTTLRLLLLTLLAEIFTYESEKKTNNDENHAMAMECFLRFFPEKECASHAHLKNGSNSGEPSHIVWGGLCSLFFTYPENNLCQLQFYRLLLAVLKKNHELSLKAIIQKCKLLSSLIKICSNNGSKEGGENEKSSVSSSSKSHLGSGLRCLNAIRLQSQALPPTSFLCRFLDSHDGWRAFLPTLMDMTIERNLPGGGVALPTRSSIVSKTDIGKTASAITSPSSSSTTASKQSSGGPAASSSAAATSKSNAMTFFSPPSMLENGLPWSSYYDMIDSCDSASTHLVPLLSSTTTKMKLSDVNIDLGSDYALELGFDSSVTKYRTKDEEMKPLGDCSTMGQMRRERMKLVEARKEQNNRDPLQQEDGGCGGSSINRSSISKAARNKKKKKKKKK